MTNEQYQAVIEAKEMMEANGETGVTFYEINDSGYAQFEVDGENGTYQQVLVNLNDLEYITFKKEYVLVAPDFDNDTNDWFVSHISKEYDYEYDLMDEKDELLKEYKSWKSVPKFLEKQTLPYVIAR